MQKMLLTKIVKGDQQLAFRNWEALFLKSDKIQI